MEFVSEDDIMEITEIRVHLRDEDKLKAFVTATYDACFVVRNTISSQAISRSLLICICVYQTAG